MMHLEQVQGEGYPLGYGLFELVLICVQMVHTVCHLNSVTLRDGYFMSLYITLLYVALRYFT